MSVHDITAWRVVSFIKISLSSTRLRLSWSSQYLLKQEVSSCSSRVISTGWQEGFPLPLRGLLHLLKNSNSWAGGEGGGGIEVGNVEMEMFVDWECTDAVWHWWLNADAEQLTCFSRATLLHTLSPSSCQTRESVEFPSYGSGSSESSLSTGSGWQDADLRFFGGC